MRSLPLPCVVYCCRLEQLVERLPRERITVSSSPTTGCFFPFPGKIIVLYVGAVELCGLPLS